MIQEFFVFALKNLRKRKLRSFLTMIGIILSIAIVFVLISLSIGLRGAIQQEFKQLGTDKFFVQPTAALLAGPGTASSSAGFTTKDADIVKRTPGVSKLTYLVIGSAEVKNRDNIRFYQVTGVPIEALDIFSGMDQYIPEDGRFLTKGDVDKTIVGNSFKTGNLFGVPLRVGDKIEVNGKEFKVKGILKSFGDPQNDKSIFISFDDFKSLFNSGDRIDEIIVQVNDNENIADVADRVEKNLLKYRNLKEDNKDFRIFTPEELLASFSLILNILTGFLIGVAGISLVVGGIGIANTMYTSVLRGAREIGIMKAIGARNKDILSIFLIESGVLGLVGGATGVILGFGISKMVEYIISSRFGLGLLKAAAPWYLILGCLVFAFGIGAFFGVWPAYRASRVRPVEA